MFNCLKAVSNHSLAHHRFHLSLSSLRYPSLRFFATVNEGANPTDPSPTSSGSPKGPPATNKKKVGVRNVAVVLSGSGIYDGSEITETVSFLIALSHLNLKFQCYAPDKPQYHVVNHLTGNTTEETRNVLVESARIARGNVKNLAELKVEDYDAVVFPGGFGAVKNFSDRLVAGDDFKVDPAIEQILKDFHLHKKPIGLACISPILAARVLGKISKNKIKITLGRKGDSWPYADNINSAVKMGVTHKLNNANAVCVDKKNKIYSVPAFMEDTFNFDRVYQGIFKLVEELKNAHKRGTKKGEDNEESAEQKK